MVSIIDNLCTKQGNSSIFGPKIQGLLSRAVSNQERVIMAHVRYVLVNNLVGCSDSLETNALWKRLYMYIENVPMVFLKV